VPTSSPPPPPSSEEEEEDDDEGCDVSEVEGEAAANSIYMVSDGTGWTLEHSVNAVLGQFEHCLVDRQCATSTHLFSGVKIPHPSLPSSSAMPALHEMCLFVAMYCLSLEKIRFPTQMHYLPI
jgi:hypothetical protein